jgi:hypothetical protein
MGRGGNSTLDGRAEIGSPEADRFWERRSERIPQEPKDCHPQLRFQVGTGKRMHYRFRVWGTLEEQEMEAIRQAAVSTQTVADSGDFFSEVKHEVGLGGMSHYWLSIDAKLRDTEIAEIEQVIRAQPFHANARQVYRRDQEEDTSQPRDAS